MDDNFYFSCPCCSCELELDTEGTISAVEPTPLKDNEKRGLGGLRVEDYTATYTPPVQRVMQPLTSVADSPNTESEPLQVAADEQKLYEANQNDLKLRNLK